MGYPGIHRDQARRLMAGPRTGRRMAWAAAVAAALAVLPGALSGVPATARPLDDVVASRSLRVIAYEDNAPFSWIEGGKPRGIDVELGAALAAKLGVAAEIVLRMPGENVDDDLRANIWRGPLTGGGVGDVMLHVPIDRDLSIRNNLVVIGNPYFQEQVSLAVDPASLGDIVSFDVFRREKVGVQLGTVADYFLMRYDNGALINNVDHHLRPHQGIERFIAKQTAGIMGVRSAIEAMLFERKATAKWVDLPTPGIVRKSWLVGMAVSEKSRDLQYALGAALKELRQSGELDRICARYGITYTPPPDP